MYQAYSLGNRLNPVTLSFCDAKLERAFRASHQRKMLIQVRKALVIAAILYLLYAVLDFIVLAEGHWKAALIRFAIVVPIFALGYVATYRQFFRRRLQTLVMIMVFTGGIGLSFIGISSEATHSDLYFLGPVFPIFWAFIYSGLRYINALIIGLILICCYNIIYISLGQYTEVFIWTYNFYLVTTLIIGALGGYTIEKYYRLDFVNQKLLSEEKSKNDKLLLNILPRSIANELKEHQGTIARDYDEICVLFADLVGFSGLSQEYSAQKVVGILNDIFSRFDELTDKYELEKIKTIGDSYMVVSNLQINDAKSPHKILEFAMEIMEFIDEYNASSGLDLKLRVGVHVGQAVAGVIGVKKFVYDVWGSTVNIASRMESSCPVNAIQVSQAVYDVVENEFEMEPRGDIKMKGFGSLPAYLVKGKKTTQLKQEELVHETI